MKPVLLIDNHDSFTFNLVEGFRRLGAPVRVLRNTASAGEALETAVGSGALVVISPGPGAPEESGCCLELIAKARGVVPLFGVCLGHQAIAQEAGAAVVRAATPVHGKTLLLSHSGGRLFDGVPSPTPVARYHSLCVPELPARFEVLARGEGIVMAFHDPDAMQTGVQFHPESILTPHGERMLENVLRQAPSPAAAKQESARVDA